MKNISVKTLAEISIVAAIYVVLTVALTPLSYGDVQFRLSEALMLLILYRRRYAISMILGCLVANLFSPVGWVDILFGTLATVIASIPMLFIKKLEISSIFPSIANGIIVGLELAIVYDLPIAITMIQVFVGEFVVVSLVGVPLFKSLQKNEGFMRAIDAEPLKDNMKWLNTFVSLSLAINIIGLICFYKLSFNTDEFNPDTLYERLKDGQYLGLILIVLPLVSFVVTIFLNKVAGLSINMLIAALFIGAFVYVVVSSDYNPHYTFYLYLFVPLLLILVEVLRFISNNALREA